MIAKYGFTDLSVIQVRRFVGEEHQQRLKDALMDF